MIATDVASPFLTPLKLTLVLAVFVSVPYVLFQAWGFVAPALYQNEKRLVFPLLLSSTVLFYLGILFAYFVVFPLVFRFFTNAAPAGVTVMTDISRYLDFVLKMFFAFGVAFEVPIATILLIWTGMTTAESLASKRPYIIVVVFVIGAFLTPPDVFSQTMLALPMWLLFELGLIMSKFYTKKSSEQEEEDENATAYESNATATATASAGASSVTASPGPDRNAGSIVDFDEEPYRPMTEEEMDDELDRIEAEEEDEQYEYEGENPHEEYEPLPDESETDSGESDKPSTGDLFDDDKSGDNSKDKSGSTQQSRKDDDDK